MAVKTPLLLLACGAVLVTAGVAEASERQFTYTHNTSTLPPGQREIEPWTTFLVGRESFFFKMVNRLELEAGLTDWLQGAFYLNASTTTADVVPEGETETVRETELEFEGVSVELKFKITDAVADVLGFGLYLESSIGPTEGELEGKVLIDKRAGDFYLAYNLVGEWEVGFGESADVEHELKIEHDLGLAGYVRDDVTIGVEVRNQTVYVVDEGFEGSTFFAGPAVSIRGKGFWIAASILPQIGAIKSEEAEDGAFDLEHNERLQARLLIGYDL